jgi:hypothetical protein
MRPASSRSPGTWTNSSRERSSPARRRMSANRLPSAAMRRCSPAASHALGVHLHGLGRRVQGLSTSPRFHSRTASAVSLAVWAAFWRPFHVPLDTVTGKTRPVPGLTTRSRLSLTSTATVCRPTDSAATLTGGPLALFQAHARGHAPHEAQGGIGRRGLTSARRSTTRARFGHGLDLSLRSRHLLPDHRSRPDSPLSVTSTPYGPGRDHGRDPAQSLPARGIRAETATSAGWRRADRR